MKTYKAIFFGTPEFAVPALDALLRLPFIKLQAVVTQPDKPVGKKQIITPPPVKQLAEKNKIKVLQPATIKSNAFLDQLSGLSPDVIIIIAYGKIIPKKFLSIPPYGWLNLHASLLPKYRGASPIQAAILNGESKTGVTLMKLDAGLDTGPIIAQEEITISDQITLPDLHDQLSLLSAKFLKKYLDKYLTDEIKPVLQEESPTPVTKTIKKEDGKIDWNNEAEFIDRQIRAYSPWPGTYTFWNDKRLKIINADFMLVPKKLEPGRVFRHGSNILIGTKKNAIRLIKIQLAGKKPMDIQSFIKGYPAFTETELK